MSALHEDALEIPAFLKRAKGEKPDPALDAFYRERPLSKIAKPELSADEVERARITAEAEEHRLAKSRGRVATMKARFAAKDAVKAGKVFDPKTGLYFDPKAGSPKLSDVLGANAKEQDMNVTIEPRTYSKPSDAKRAAMAMLGPDAHFEIEPAGKRFVFQAKPVTKKPPSAKNAKPAKIASGKTGIARQFDGHAGPDDAEKAASAALRAAHPGLKTGAELAAKGGKPKKPGKKVPAKPARKGKAPAAASAPVKAGKPADGAPKAPTGKTAIIRDLLLKPEGTTTKEVLEATGWPSVSMPQQAKSTGLTLRKEKVKGEPTRYFGTPA